MANSENTHAVSENALANQQVKVSRLYGGSSGDAYTLMSGDYVKTIEFGIGGFFKLQSIAVEFNNLKVAHVGGGGDTPPPVSRVKIDLEHDSISKLYVKEVTGGRFGSGKGVEGVYLETVHGGAYSTLGDADSPLTRPTAWIAVTTPQGDTLTNIVLVGVAGRAGMGIDALSFYYKGDVLMSHGVTHVVYGEFIVGLPTPLNVAGAMVSNQTDQAQQMSISFSDSVSSSYTFSTTVTETAGLETTVEAGIPFVANGEVTVSASVSLSVTLGVSKSITDTFTYLANVNVGAGESLKANAIATTYTIEAPYTAKFSEVWVHAGAVTKDIEGRIRGVSAYEVDVSYDRRAPEAVKRAA
jgi:Clostridium epsilon toxin ETX/Bacillus mosquitocidal toxin MTX2